jgi:hypothetical protein
MAIRNAYVHLYQKISRGIFHGITEEISVEAIPLYYPQREIVQTKARSNFVLMFA